VFLFGPGMDAVLLVSIGVRTDLYSYTISPFITPKFQSQVTNETEDLSSFTTFEGWH